MNTPEIITWLRDQAKRVPEDVHKRGMIQAAAILERLRNNLKIAVAQRNEYQENYWAEKERSDRLEAELKAEMHRHDLLQDFEVAEAKELKNLKAEKAEYIDLLGQQAWELAQRRIAEQEGRLIILDETAALAMAAGARSIENNRRLSGTIYCWDPFGTPKEISYYAAAKKLRELSQAVLEKEVPTDA